MLDKIKMYLYKTNRHFLLRCVMHLHAHSITIKRRFKKYFPTLSIFLTKCIYTFIALIKMCILFFTSYISKEDSYKINLIPKKYRYFFVFTPSNLTPKELVESPFIVYFSYFFTLITLDVRHAYYLEVHCLCQMDNKELKPFHSPLMVVDSPEFPPKDAITNTDLITKIKTEILNISEKYGFDCIKRVTVIVMKVKKPKTSYIF